MKKSNKNYIKLVEWSIKDNTYVGTCPGTDIVVNGDDEVKTYNATCKAVAKWIIEQTAKNKKLPETIIDKEYSGKFIIRIEPSLHKLIALKALCAGISINAYCINKLEK